jgi:hypothetical protein
MLNVKYRFLDPFTKSESLLNSILVSYTYFYFNPLSSFQDET